MLSIYLSNYPFPTLPNFSDAVQSHRLECLVSLSVHLLNLPLELPLFFLMKVTNGHHVAINNKTITNNKTHSVLISLDFSKSLRKGEKVSAGFSQIQHNNETTLCCVKIRRKTKQTLLLLFLGISKLRFRNF